MKTTTKILLVVLVLLLIFGSSVIGSYNNIVTLKETATTELQNIDTQLQRRADLIPNLVNTVKGFTTQEQNIVDSVTEARAKLAGADSVGEKADANAELTGALNGLLVVVENYPEIKSDANFMQLSDELAGTENRIAVSRLDYNNAVREYNTKIKTFPGSLYASIFNFEILEYFEASEGADEVPEVSF